MTPQLVGFEPVGLGVAGGFVLTVHSAVQHLFPPLPQSTSGSDSHVVPATGFPVEQIVGSSGWVFAQINLVIVGLKTVGDPVDG